MTNKKPKKHKVNLETTQNINNDPTPGYLLSNLPGALGFFPFESLVLMGFEQRGTSLSLGPIARVDLSSLETQCDEAFEVIANGNHVVFAFVISSRPVVELDWVADFLFEYSSSQDRGIDACWHTAEVSVGQRYELWFGPDNGGDDPMPEWTEGKIPAIIEAESMKQWISSGKLPEITRDDVLRRLGKRNPCLTKEDIQEIQTHAQEKAMVWLASRCARRNHGVYKPTDNPAQHLRNNAEETLAKARTATITTLYSDKEILEEVATWMSHVAVRDVVIKTLLDSPEVTEKVMLATMHTFTGTVRTNALVIYAATCISQEMSMVGGLALSVAIIETPDHRLARLVNQAYRAGLHTRLIRNLNSGSQLAFDNWLRTGVSGGKGSSSDCAAA